MRTIVAGLLAASILAGPSLAQTDPATGRDPATEAARGYVGVPSPAEPAVDAQQRPVTQALNAAGADGAAAASDAEAANQSQYAADRAAYMDALVRHDRSVDRADARYVRQQRGYADAMSVWRVQVDECKKGHRKACDLPAPNPADYY